MRTRICSLILAAISLSGLRAGTAPGIDAVQVASGLTQPLYVTAPPGDAGRLFIVQQDGNIRILNLFTGTLNSTPFLTVTGLTRYERRARSAWHGVRSKLRHEREVLSQLHRPRRRLRQRRDARLAILCHGDPDIADPASERILIMFDHPQDNHNGGWIGFSPRTDDANNLYIATGDGGGRKRFWNRTHRTRW